jgi:hypothetical protein
LLPTQHAAFGSYCSQLFEESLSRVRPSKSKLRFRIGFDHCRLTAVARILRGRNTRSLWTNNPKENPCRAGGSNRVVSSNRAGRACPVLQCGGEGGKSRASSESFSPPSLVVKHLQSDHCFQVGIRASHSAVIVLRFVLHNRWRKLMNQKAPCNTPQDNIITQGPPTNSAIPLPKHLELFAQAIAENPPHNVN